MKKYIRSSSLFGDSKKFGDGWTQRDIEIWNSVDWAERNYEPYVVDDDVITGKVYLYGLPGGAKTTTTEFMRVIYANPIYPPVYSPDELDPFKMPRRRGLPTYVGPMYDGRKRNGIKVLDRYETQDLYDLSAD